jgi:ERCC4-related helicase
MTELQWIETATGPGDTLKEICSDLGIDTTETATERDPALDQHVDDQSLGR